MTAVFENHLSPICPKQILKEPMNSENPSVFQLTGFAVYKLSKGMRVKWHLEVSLRSAYFMRGEIVICLSTI